LFLSHDTATTEFYTLSLHDALPISRVLVRVARHLGGAEGGPERDRGSAPAVPREAGDHAGDRAAGLRPLRRHRDARRAEGDGLRSEEHTSELQSQSNLVCRLLLEKK